MAVGLGSIPTQDLMQRSMSAKNEAVSVRGTFLAGMLYLVFGVMSPLIGIVMFKLDPTIPPENTEFLLLSAALRISTRSWPPLFIAALASALMSTSDSSVLAGASVFTQTSCPSSVKSMTDKDKLRWTRIVVVVSGLISVGVALLAGTIYQLAMVAWSLLLVGLLLRSLSDVLEESQPLRGDCGVPWQVRRLDRGDSGSDYQTTIVVCEADFECGFWDADDVAFTPAFFTSVGLADRRLVADPAPRPGTDRSRTVDGNPMPFKNRLGWLRPKNVWRFGSDKDAEAERGRGREL